MMIHGRYLKFLHNFQSSKLADFSQLSYDVLVWDDPTLVKALGVCLATRSSPMVLVQEFFELGPLDHYLKVVQDSHLLLIHP